MVGAVRTMRGSGKEGQRGQGGLGSFCWTNEIPYTSIPLCCEPALLPLLNADPERRVCSLAMSALSRRCASALVRQRPRSHPHRLAALSVALPSSPALASRSITTTRTHSSLAIADASLASKAHLPFDHPAASIFKPLDTFTPRHIGPREQDVQAMLKTVGYASMDQFIDACVPSHIRIVELNDQDVRPFSELELLRRAEKLAAKNRPMKSYIGMGYHNAIVPPVIQRNVSRSGSGA